MACPKSLAAIFAAAREITDASLLRMIRSRSRVREDFPHVGEEAKRRDRELNDKKINIRAFRKEGEVFFNYPHDAPHI